jgi:hypothetical protein
VNQSHDAEPPFWALSRIVAAIAAVLWTYLVFIGINLIQEVGDQHLLGCPDQEQIRIAILCPLFGLGNSIAIFGLANKLNVWINLCITVLALLPVSAMLLG